MDKTLVRTEESAGAVVRRCSLNKVPESLFNEVSGLEICNVVKNDSSKDVFT